jgi:protein tyrosine phosphatase (PTP) superfamily phosphohydrolase (DUF442 family)
MDRTLLCLCHMSTSGRLARWSVPAVMALILGPAGWSLAADEAPAPGNPPAPAQVTDGAEKTAPVGGRDLGHMHNVHEMSPRFFRGSAPVTESDFALLAKLGVKVVVSVDGAKPDVAAAKKHGLRYVHVPFGYSGVPRAQQVLLYKAFTTLEGPFFVHCHHGKHRGPAACAVGLLGVETWTVEQVVAEMKLAGTAAKYDGLYAVPAAFVRPTAEELAAAPKEIPELTPPAPFTEAMVELDGVWDRIKAVRTSKWSAPADHPDVDPSHEAVILAESFRELARGALADKKAAAFVKHLTESENAAWDLAKALDKKALDPLKAQEAYARVEASCTACHTRHRDPSLHAR